LTPPRAPATARTPHRHNARRPGPRQRGLRDARRLTTMTPSSSQELEMSSTNLCNALCLLFAMSSVACGPRPIPEDPTAHAEPSARLAFGDEVMIEMASVEQGRATLGTSDAYIQAMSPFDRQVRLDSATPVDETT